MKCKSALGPCILSALGGAAIGAGIMLLFAPEKGSVMRKKISREAEDVVDSLMDKIDDIKDSVEDFIENEARRAKRGAKKAKVMARKMR